MAQLFVEVYSISDDEASVPTQSAICIFVLSYLQCPPDISLTLVKSDPQEPCLRVCLRTLQYCVIDPLKLKSPVSDCCLPVLQTVDSASCVAGLCSVLRQVVKHSGEKWRHLLGFREGCLFACAEVSSWTKFCEIDIVQTVCDTLSTEEQNCENVKIHEHLARFEEHLNQPVRMHNVDKLRKEINQDFVDHDYAEGYVISLADLVILPCVQVFLHVLGSVRLSHHLPSVMKWHDLVISQELILEALNVIVKVPSLITSLSHVNYVLPEVPKQSLYKSDPKRYKPKSKQFTRQEDVEAALSIVDTLLLEHDYDIVPFGFDIPLDWQTVPGDIQPDVPESRLARKRQQLENLSKAIIKIAKPGDRIVDFCCGSGHLGIVVAHCLPRCHVVLLDNKEESLARAWTRVNRLALSNVTIIQCNLDYFKGSFQVGVSLHACGVASDLVIQSCLQQGAAFVVCPCCYGSLQNNHMVAYPRSAALSTLSERHYLVLGHCADQTHRQLYNKSAQGEQCMAVIDRDRCLQAQEKGYSTSLAKLVPLTCSPKNNLLVGIPLTKAEDFEVNKLLL